MYVKSTIFISALSLYYHYICSNSPLCTYRCGQISSALWEHLIDGCTGTAEAAVMAFLGACGRLNIVPSKAECLWNLGRFIVWDAFGTFCREDIICARRLVVFEYK